MPSRHRSSWRRRRISQARRRTAVTIAIPVALAVVVGAIVAVTHVLTTRVSDSALTDCASSVAYVEPGATAYRDGARDGSRHGDGARDGHGRGHRDGARDGAVTATAAATGTGTATAPATGAVTATAADDGHGHRDGARDGAGTATAPTTGTATATPTSSASATPCPSARRQPAAALRPTSTATSSSRRIRFRRRDWQPRTSSPAPNGMTPDQSGCTMANATDLGAFVQATILNTRTGQLYVYDPLVITQGTTPAVAPMVPVLPTHYVATIDFGFNGTDLTQVGATANALRQGNCVNGMGGLGLRPGVVLQRDQLLQRGVPARARGQAGVPSAGTSGKIVASGGQLAPARPARSSRNFDMVDQDQSDNVTTLYLLNPATGQTAQDTTSNAGNIAGSTTLPNGSDNILVVAFLDPMLGCTPFQAPDLANNDQPTTSQALDELLAAKNQPSIPALVPENDEMTLDGQGQFDTAKTNLYRSERRPDPGQLRRTTGVDSPAMYCQNMLNIQVPFLAANQALLATGPSPVTAVGNNLFTFLANRLSMSFTNLDCQNFGLTNPVTVTLDANGVAVAATFNGGGQTAGSPSASASAAPSQGQRHGRHNHWYMNPSGM